MSHKGELQTLNRVGERESMRDKQNTDSYVALHAEWPRNENQLGVQSL